MGGRRHARHAVIPGPFAFRFGAWPHSDAFIAQGPALLTDPRPQPRRPYRSPALQAPRKQHQGNYIRTLRHLEEAEVAEEDRQEQRDGRGATDSREHVLDGAKSIYGAVDSVATLKGRLEV